MSDDDLDWYERLEQWILWFREHSPVLLGITIPVVAVVALNARWERQAAEEQARERASSSAIATHMAWLRNLPDPEKRKWPVASYCRPASAAGGSCKCEPTWGTAEVTWPERLENGDVACHVQR